MDNSPDKRRGNDGWYCAQCQRAVEPIEVTYDESHTACGRRITDDEAPDEGESASLERPLAFVDENVVKWLRDRTGKAGAFTGTTLSTTPTAVQHVAIYAGQRPGGGSSQVRGGGTGTGQEGGSGHAQDDVRGQVHAGVAIPVGHVVVPVDAPDQADEAICEMLHAGWPDSAGVWLQMTIRSRARAIYGNAIAAASAGLSAGAAEVKPATEGDGRRGV